MIGMRPIGKLKAKEAAKLFSLAFLAYNRRITVMPM
jgi:hypothetical protein